jgi:proteasome assembly chaperone (PAC2) family protein
VVLYRLDQSVDLVEPTMIAAFDSWIDSGGASTSAASQLVDAGATKDLRPGAKRGKASTNVVATFDGDLLFDYRSRRPTLEIVDGKLAELTWPELTIRRSRLGEKDLLVFTGAEPDFRWHEFADATVELVRQLGVAQWISLGAIPAAVPHTRPVPIMGTQSEPGLLRGDIRPGPDGLLRVPSAAISVLEMAVSQSGTPAVGYFAQVPHYVSGPYAMAALELLRAVGRHLDVEIPEGLLAEESRLLRSRLDAVVAAEETTRAYVDRLEAMVDEERLPSGSELIGEIERFLRDRGGDGTQRSDRPGRPN